MGGYSVVPPMGATNGAATGADGVPGGSGDEAVRRGEGYSETVFFDDAGRLRFRLDPATEPRATLVIASSLYAELQRNYRREVVLARNAAAAGFAVVRFHYRGAGNSLGDDEVSLDSMTEDLTEVARSVDGPVVLVGTRVGALAVARVRTLLDLPSVLWEPVVDGSRWVEEVVRACLAREVAQGRNVTAADIRARWESDGRVFVLGETVTSRIVGDVGATGIVAEMSGSAPVLLVQMGRDERIRPELDRASAAITGLGAPVQVLTVVGRQTWWVNEGGDLFRPVERDDATSALVEGVLAFAGMRR